jgi:hypothetical protein
VILAHLAVDGDRWPVATAEGVATGEGVGGVSFVLPTGIAQCAHPAIPDLGRGNVGDEQTVNFTTS